MTAPKTWTCDTCHEEITDPTMSLVVWSDVFTDEGLETSGFRIVHKGKKCDYDQTNATLEVSDLLGYDGLATLLQFLSNGPLIGPRTYVRIRDFDNFVDVVRRLQTPGYEEARQYFGTSEVREQFSDAGEVLPYTQFSLKKIIEIGRGASL